jgi:hypothetical protein
MEIKTSWNLMKKENTIYQNLLDKAKAGLRGKFIALKACIKNTERSQINNLMLHLKLLFVKPKKKQKERNNKNTC